MPKVTQPQTTELRFQKTPSSTPLPFPRDDASTSHSQPCFYYENQIPPRPAGKNGKPSLPHVSRPLSTLILSLSGFLGEAGEAHFSWRDLGEKMQIQTPEDLASEALRRRVDDPTERAPPFSETGFLYEASLNQGVQHSVRGEKIQRLLGKGVEVAGRRSASHFGSAHGSCFPPGSVGVGYSGRRRRLRLPFRGLSRHAGESRSRLVLSHKSGGCVWGGGGVLLADSFCSSHGCSHLSPYLI